MTKRIAIGIDLGCTNIKTVIIDEDGNVLHEDRRETNEQNDQHWKQTIRTLITDLKKEIIHNLHRTLCAGVSGY